jgi:hypothetical protein
MRISRFRHAAFAAAFLTVPGIAHAGLRDDVMTAAARCWSLSSDKAWLDCYYRAAQPMQAAINPLTPPANVGGGNAARAAVTPPPSQAPRRSRSWIGQLFRDDAARQPERVAAIPGAPGVPTDHITARLADYKFSPRGAVTLTLDNGEIWQQMEGDSSTPRLKQAARTYVVTIRPGFFGSYNLTVAGQSGLYRVRRIN